MAESNEITTGDVVCLKSSKKSNSYQKFTVGSIYSGSDFYVHWVYNGELKKEVINAKALHKIE